MDLLYGQIASTIDEFHLDLQSLKETISQIPTGAGSDNSVNELIAAATATSTIQITGSSGMTGITGLGPIGATTFCSGMQVLLEADASSAQQLGRSGNECTYRMYGVAQIDAKFMGQPIAALLTAGYIQIDFPASIIPAGSVIAGGQVVWVINNRKTLKFDVPAQKTDSSHIFIRDLSEGLQILRDQIKQPSPTPVMEAAPH